jgi:tRNA pseudouridine55 synthase/H/ACA ribonucleoprotein complex subunit 4
MLGCHAGHSGTLDPQVSGVLLVMLGNAVRLAPLLLQHEKEYICLMRLQADIGREALETALQDFTGRIYQRPPRKSAVKRNLRIRTIHSITILGIEGRLVLFSVRCDAGTYIRSLCHHIGLALGTGAHMQELRRSRSGPFSEERMHTLHELADACARAREGDPAALHALILPVDETVPDIPKVVIRDSAIDAICHGARLAAVGIVRCDPFNKNDIVAVLSQKDEVVCLGKGLVASSGFRPGDTGLVVAPVAVFMQPGTYQKGWKKRAGPA